VKPKTNEKMKFSISSVMFLLLSLAVNGIRAHDDAALFRGKAERELGECAASLEECSPVSFWTANCCEGFSCSGYASGTCHHEPRLEGEPCGFLYEGCDFDLVCHENKCVGLEKFFDHGTLGTCRGGSPEGTVKIMTYNIFLLQCVIGGYALTCQNDVPKAARVAKIADWFANRDEDVVVFQEVFSNSQEVKRGMADAGFCHHVTTNKGNSGSGMAIYSKFPILYTDFVDWFDAFGVGESTYAYNAEAYADKGVLYAQIQKGDSLIHVFDTHTQSDSYGDEHSVRMSQYEMFHNFIIKQKIPEDQLILLGGDFNEDKYFPNPEDLPPPFEGQYYKEMLHDLDASAFPILGSNFHTQSTEQNPFLAELWEGTDTASFELLLDYVLAFRQGMTPADSSSCEILHPTDPDGGMLSDHFPMTCTIHHAV
jgi:exonuclease III